jgi:trimeric autotransporter adhesin
MRTNSSRLALAAVSLLCIALLAACGGGGGGGSTPVLRSITVAPLTATIDNGTTQQFSATAYYSDGTQQPASATWSSSAATVATVDGTGLATAVGNGSTTITASQGTFTATAALTVSRTLLSIAVTPVTATVSAGLTQAYTATGTFLNADGTTTMSNISSTVGWSSSNGAVATIDVTGLATSLAVGTTNITASMDGVTSAPNAVLTVTPAVVSSVQVLPASPTLALGNTVALVAMELFTDGTTQAPTLPVVWTTSGCTPAAATTLASVIPSATNVNNQTEIAVGALAGSCTVTATEGALTAGTSSVTVVTGSTHFAYVSNSNDSTISQYAVDATSAIPLTPLSPATVTSNTPLQMVLHPNGQFVYAIDDVSRVTLLNVDAGGAGTLTANAATPVLAGAAKGTNYMVIDPTGRFLYVSDATSSSIDGFTIDPGTGLLTPIAAVTGYSVSLNAPEGLEIDHQGLYLYANNSGNGSVTAYSISGTDGALAPLTKVSYATGTVPLFGTISASNNLYIANSGDNTVSAFSITAGTGALTGLAPTASIPAAFALINVTVDPTNTYLYVLDTGSATGSVYGFTLGANGAVGPAIAGTPVSSGAASTGIVIDPSGTLLAVDNNGDDTITPFSVVTTTGTPTGETPVATGAGPLFVVFYNAP